MVDTISRHCRAIHTFPKAETLLGEEDWARIDAAFAGNRDPIVDGAEKSRYDNLRRRILELGLPPMGLPSG